MTDRFVPHEVMMSRVSDPALHPAAFAAAFNSGDPAAVEAMYEPGAVFVTPDGTAVTGAARIAANQRFLALGLPIRVEPRAVHTSGDIALLIVDWTITGDGVRLAGTATDVARRGPDGTWRYVVDNPFGVGTPQP